MIDDDKVKSVSFKVPTSIVKDLKLFALMTRFSQAQIVGTCLNMCMNDTTLREKVKKSLMKECEIKYNKEKNNEKNNIS